MGLDDSGSKGVVALAVHVNHASSGGAAPDFDCTGGGIFRRWSNFCNIFCNHLIMRSIYLDFGAEIHGLLRLSCSHRGDTLAILVSVHLVRPNPKQSKSEVASMSAKYVFVTGGVCVQFR